MAAAIAATLPLAHVSHYLWVLYVPPVLIVIFAIARAVILERREEREQNAGKAAERDAGKAERNPPGS